MVRLPSPWPDLDERLRELWASGMTTPKIGEALGLTKNAIIGRAHRLELPMRHKTPGPRGTNARNARRATKDKTVRARVPKNPRPLPPPPPPPRPKPRVNNGPLSILEVGSVHCRAIIGDAQAEKTMMCADRVSTNDEGVPYSYCERHVRAFYTGPGSRLR